MNTISSFIHRKVVILNEEVSLQVAARALRDNEVGSILVINSDGSLVGIATDRDFACRGVAEFSSFDGPLSRIMSRDLIKVDENAELQQVLYLMENYGVRRIPVMGRTPQGKERVLGILTLDDLIASGTIAPSTLGRIVKRQIGKRAGHAPTIYRSARAFQRSQAHRTQTQSEFYSFLSQATGLTPQVIPAVSHFLLSSLIMRIPASSAAHFLAQLPSLIQASLADQPPGPDRTITVEWILDELVSRFQFTQELASFVLSHFCEGLEHFLSPGQITHLRSQLPLEFHPLFPQTEEEKKVFTRLSTSEKQEKKTA
ncbi:MAG: CBS domain-containing protein [Bdellovibrionia bacterium]